MSSSGSTATTLSNVIVCDSHKKTNYGGGSTTTGDDNNYGTLTLPSGGTWRWMSVDTSSDNYGAVGQAAGGTTVSNVFSRYGVCIAIRVA